MKVYIVNREDLDPDGYPYDVLEGVFSSKEKAENYLKQLSNPAKWHLGAAPNFNIDSTILDNPE